MGKRIAIIFGVVLLALVAVFCLVPVLFQKQISERVKIELNHHINARVDYKGLHISWFSSFPNLTVSLTDLSVTGDDGDTLTSVKEFGFTIDMISIVLNKGYKVISLNLEQPVLKLRINKDGRANWDIIKQPLSLSKDAYVGKELADTGLSFQINNWEIEHGRFEFSNDSLQTFFIADDLNSKGREFKNKTGSDIDLRAISREVSYTAGGITYLQKVKLDAGLKVSSNMATGIYQIAGNSIVLNDLQLGLKGSFKNTTEGRDYNLTIEARDSAFKDMLSLIPAINDSTFAQTKAGGVFSFSGNIKGLNSANQSPAFSFKLNVRDGVLQRSGAAQPIKDIFIDANAVKPEGPMDSTLVEVSRFYIETGKDSANAHILITTPASNAKVTAEVRGTFDVASLLQFYSANDVKQLSGALHVDLKLAGHKNDIDQKNYDRIQTYGQMEAGHVLFQKNDWPVALEIKEADFKVVPGYVGLNITRAHIGKSELKGTGIFEHVIPFLAGQRSLTADLKLIADTINIREFASSAKQQKGSKQNVAGATQQNVTVGTKSSPEYGIDLTVCATAKRIYDDKLVFNNLQGTLRSRGDSIQIKVTTADLFGGHVKFEAGCNHVKQAQPDMTFSMNATDIDIARVYQSIDDPEKNAPALKYLSGSFSGAISGFGKLKSDYTLNYSALTANGNLHYPDLRINEMPVLMEIGKLAKVKSLEHLEAKNVQSDFHFKNGTSTIDPTDIKFTTGYKLNFKGTNYANQTVDADIALDVPVKEFGSIGSLAQNLLSGFMSVPENVHFVFKVTGKNTQPDVKVVNVGTSGN